MFPTQFSKPGCCRASTCGSDHGTCDEAWGAGRSILQNGCRSRNIPLFLVRLLSVPKYARNPKGDYALTPARDFRFWSKLDFPHRETGNVQTLDQKVTVTEKNLRQYRRLFGDFQERVKGYDTKYGLGCTRTSTEIPFDELILKMMRVAGAVR